jgi:hypothetical protein
MKTEKTMDDDLPFGFPSGLLGKIIFSLMSLKCM